MSVDPAVHTAASAPLSHRPLIATFDRDNATFGLTSKSYGLPVSVQVDIARTQNATAVVHMMYRLCVCVQLYRTGRVYATATAPTVSLCLVPPAAPVLPVSGYAYVAPVPNRVYHCRYVAGSWVFRVRSLDTVQLDTDTGEQYNIGSQIPLQ